VEPLLEFTYYILQCISMHIILIAVVHIYLCKVVVPWISSSYSADNCRHQGHAGSKTLHQQNPPVLHWRCWLTQVDLYNGRKTVVVVFVDNWSRLFTRGISGRFLLTKTVSAMH